MADEKMTCEKPKGNFVIEFPSLRTVRKSVSVEMIYCSVCMEVVGTISARQTESLFEITAAQFEEFLLRYGGHFNKTGKGRLICLKALIIALNKSGNDQRIKFLEE